MVRIFINGDHILMRHRYFLIEPKYSDPDTFCNFVVGSSRVRASIQIYADLEKLAQVADALVLPLLERESPEPSFEINDEYGIFCFDLSVMPHRGGDRVLKFVIFQEFLDDGAPHRTEIRFHLTAEEASEFSRKLAAWCDKPEFALIWKGD